MRFLLFGAGEALQSDEAPAALRDGEILWCDCHYDEARAWVDPVARLTGIQVFENHLLDAENHQHPSYFDSTQRYEMIVFRGLAFTIPRSDEAVPIRVRTRPTVFFVFPRCLVTVRAADSRLVPALQDRLVTAAQGSQRLPTAPEELMLRLLNAMVDRYLELRQPLTEQLERWQRLLLDPRRPFRDWLALLEARSELRKLEQLCEEQLDALQEWRDERLEREARESSLGPLTDSLQVRANDVVEHIHRVLNHARRLQDAAESAVQLHFSSTAYRTNEIMRTLTTITAIFLPLTLITGIFGMNFEFIPGLHSQQGFWVALGSMLLIAAVLLAYFRARRFLSDSSAASRQRRAHAARAARAGHGEHGDRVDPADRTDHADHGRGEGPRSDGEPHAAK
jgi:Mg2+ and Co2+ transporter CorA